SFSPLADEQINQCASLEAVNLIGANIVIPCVLSVLMLHCCDHEISIQRLQNVLIGSSGERITYHDVLMLHRCTNTVRDDTVVGEVTATNHIARPCRRNRYTTIGKEAVLIGMRHQF